MPPRLRTLLAWWRWLLIIAYSVAGAALTVATAYRQYDTWVAMTAFCGTPHYMAPELMPLDATGRPRSELATYDERCDTFSVGVLLWAIATRCDAADSYGLDYNKPLRSQLYEKVTSGVRPRFPSSCGTPLAWQELAARCWAPTPRERPPMEEVKRAMEAVGTAGALGM